MLIMVTEEHVLRGFCDSQCPGGSISSGDYVYIMPSEVCTDCEGQEVNQRVEVCPADRLVRAE